MKKLTRVKLINWHRFVNNIIEFESSTLLSGENGAGKSTLLDAIQYVVTCSTSHFNEAAHENGKRKLTGYIRCKTGKENQVYERTGEISAHIALEFYEEKKKQYFVVGAVVDSASEGQEKIARYLMDKTTLEDITFIADNIPKSINQFRSLHDKRIKQWCTTDKDARIMMKNRFGRIDDKFFNLIPKAMAFRPINDIKDFVYSYVLDEKEVNIDILRENVRAYQELQKTLDSVRLRIGKLENIERLHDRVVTGMESDKMYDYYLENAEADILQDRIKKLERQMDLLENSLKETDIRLQAIAREKKERQSIRDALHTELAADKDFIAIDEQKKRLEQLKLRTEALEPERTELYNSAKQAKRIISELMQLTETPAYIGRYMELLDNMKHIDDPEQIAELKTVLQEVMDYKQQDNRSAAGDQ